MADSTEPPEPESPKERGLQLLAIAIDGVIAQPRMAFEVNSVPLSLTIIPGLPRASISIVSSRATRLPEIEVSGIAARQARVISSTMLRMRKRRPRANWSWTKSSDQRALTLASTRIGVRVPTARRRALRL